MAQDDPWLVSSDSGARRPGPEARARLFHCKVSEMAHAKIVWPGVARKVLPRPCCKDPNRTAA
eukprot:11224712-Lingulodinium_polyedra.AAC.1